MNANFKCISHFFYGFIHGVSIVNYGLKTKNMKRFETIKFDKTKTLQKEGMEISSYIAGVNSGVYGMPFIIAVRCWASKWWFKKFFYQEIKLNIFEVRQLKEELDKVIEFYENKQTE